jgi:nucleoside-diphosphate-sugar epimerase
MKVLITGAGSIIGRALTATLLATGHAVVAYDLRGEDMPTGATFIKGDVMDFSRLAEAARSCDAGIHLATLAGESRQADILSVNVLGAYGFLQAARGTGFCNAVIAGSAPVHLPQSEHDNDLCAPTESSDHPYDLSKVLQDVIGSDFHRHGLPVMVLRLGHVVHGREQTTLEGNIPLAEEPYCRGGWVALEDVTTACAAALTLTPDPDMFEVLSLVGARSGRERFRVAATEARLGIRLQFDFAAYA